MRSVLNGEIKGKLNVRPIKFVACLDKTPSSEACPPAEWTLAPKHVAQPHTNLASGLAMSSLSVIFSFVSKMKRA